jgi:hypothetical protein
MATNTIVYTEGGEAWTPPADMDRTQPVVIDCVGSGGIGETGGVNGGHGAGAGGFARKTVTLDQTHTYSWGVSGPGEETSVKFYDETDAESVCEAESGLNGDNSGNGGAGVVGDILKQGGDGGTRGTTGGGGGGETASLADHGGQGVNGSTGTGGAGGSGTAGANGGAGGNALAAGQNGTGLGAGGGGGGSTQAGGLGITGNISFTYTVLLSDTLEPVILNDLFWPCPVNKAFTADLVSITGEVYIGIDYVIQDTNPASSNAGPDQTIKSGNTVQLDGTNSSLADTPTWTTSGDGTFDNNHSLTAVYTPGATDIAVLPATIILTLTNVGAFGTGVDTMVVTITA